MQWLRGQSQIFTQAKFRRENSQGGHKWSSWKPKFLLSGRFV